MNRRRFLSLALVPVVTASAPIGAMAAVKRVIKYPLAFPATWQPAFASSGKMFAVDARAVPLMEKFRSLYYPVHYGDGRIEWYPKKNVSYSLT